MSHNCLAWGLFAFCISSTLHCQTRLQSLELQKKCLEGTWGESDQRAGAPLHPGITWILKIRKFRDFSELSAVRDDNAIVIRLYKPEQSIATSWKGTMISSDGMTMDIVQDFQSDETNCRLLSIAPATWFLKRLPTDPTPSNMGVNAIPNSNFSPQPDVPGVPGRGTPPNPAAQHRSATPPPRQNFPNITIDDTRPTDGHKGICDPSTEVSVNNHEGHPVTVVVHKVVVTNGTRVPGDHTVTLPAHGGEYQGCRSGTSFGRTQTIEVSVTPQ